ncbi:hypothetical protein EGT09_02255 [Pseudomonas putida]|uniref:hypothetical protein n=1 Tax=Pseudomonas putida TaxID=303 RepID=UPI000F777C1D|nr:hypothetical protein [Pseudomonas putida]RSC25289.1 hypothetical protein EGT09_02255 [Pseudomonas putida]
MSDLNPITQFQLEAETKKFFGMHWNTDLIGTPSPSWQVWNEFKGSAPNYQLGGCYALFAGMLWSTSALAPVEVAGCIVITGYHVVSALTCTAWIKSAALDG